MEHFPGNSIVNDAQAANEAGNEVQILVRGREKFIMVTSIGQEGPYAVIKNAFGTYYIRKDELIGYVVK